MKSIKIAIAAVTGLMLSIPAWPQSTNAQQGAPAMGPGMGPGMGGMGPGMGGMRGMGPGMGGMGGMGGMSGMGPGMGGMGGMGPGRGRMAFNQGNTAGWTMMTPEERTAHRQKMGSFKTYDECKAYQSEHHAAMEAKAKEQGKTLPTPRANACDRMKARGMIK